MQTQTKKIILSIFIVTVMAGPAFLGGRYLQSSLIPSPYPTTTLYSSPENSNTNAATSTGGILPETPLSYCPPTCITPYIPEDLSETHFARHPLIFLLATGIMEVNTDHLIVPNAPTTRATLARATQKTFSLPILDTYTISPFRDISVNHPSYNAILSLYNSKLIKGYNDDTFRPDQSISRAEAIKVIVMAAFPSVQINENFQRWKNTYPDYTFVHFPDVQLDAWYAPYVHTMVSENIIKGTLIDGVKYFLADQPLTHGELSVILASMIEKYELHYVNK